MKYKKIQLKNQLKLFPFKKVWKEFGLKVIIFLLVLFGGYYIFFLAPKLALPNAYLETQKIFTEHKTNLVQNRVILIELAQLTENSDNLFNKETKLLQQLQETNEKGIGSLEKNQKIPHISGASNKFLNFLNNDLSNAFLSLLLKERQILEEQQDLIFSLVKFNSITADLLRYNSEQDLGKFNLTMQKEEITLRVKNAKIGVKKIAENLNTFEQEMKEITLLQKELQKTQNIVNTKELIRQFKTLKEKVLFVQFALIRSDASIKLLTRQTNLILEYEFWLKQISIYQAKLSTLK